MQTPPDRFGGLLAADQVRGWVMHRCSSEQPLDPHPESQPGKGHKTAKAFMPAGGNGICHGVTASLVVA